MTPDYGGRRSRRGFAYQDAVTLLDCLDMHDGNFSEVGFEDLDDIVCMLQRDAIYRQVKTKEDATRHSISTICAAEKSGKPETSILGRLFSGKILTDSTRFCLVLNTMPTADLAAFKVERGQVRSEVSERHCAKIVESLRGLPLVEKYNIRWHIDRFEVLIEARTIEQVEAIILSRLNKPVAKILGQSPLMSELQDVLIALCGLVARDARTVQPKRWSAEFFSLALQEAVTHATGRRADGELEPLQSLAAKLEPAGVLPDEARAQVDAMLGYRRRYRTAIGSERAYFDSLNDHVFALCTEICAQRRAGLIPPGAAAYAKTLQAVAHLESGTIRTTPLPEKFAALSDVTARCQNRYSDDT
jgi:hypothetical protein